ncbi:MAG: exodeoxyribonuclease V beta subunit [Oleiphilaceae bacterium]|jgi:exodeoxyribonuclease V beta subunit
MKALNLLNFPLDGLSLIEASAGTGKTYALANLYLRYLLEKQFTVDQILVVTFTEAATQELKDRIRCRIKELGEVFDGAETKDDVLSALLHASVIKENVEADYLRLKVAERQIDQAEIHTIHGFCQQLLRTHALDSKSPLKQTLLEDQKPLLKQVIEDYWRQHVLALGPGELAYVCANWDSPNAILRSIQPLLNRSPEMLIPSVLDGGLGAWSQCYAEAITWFSVLKEKVAESIDELEALIAKSDLKRLKDKQNWLAKIKVWSEEEGIDFSFPNAGKRANLFVDFLPENLLAQTKAKGSAPAHSFFDFLSRHLSSEPPSLKAQLVVQSYDLVREMLAQVKRDQRVLGFDDLILNVSNALISSDEAFAEIVRTRYQVALIDEFQDTDQTQYHIFSTLFGVDSGSYTDVDIDAYANDELGIETSRLVLIGDPKQAIYAFRGGDIATYLRAKGEISAHPRGNVFTMDTNWRSSPQMVEAVNAVFSGLDNPFRAKDIPFQTVKAAKKSDERLPSTALFITQLESEGLNKEQMSSKLADHSAQQISVLLSSFSDPELGSKKGEQAFKNSDIAILVRSGAEGELIKQRLSNIGISASFEGKSSIFESVEASAIYFLLQAVADPKNEFAVRRCLAEMLYGINDEQYKKLNDDSEVLSRYLDIFEGLHKRWSNAGVLAMVREALRLLKVYEYWQSTDIEAISNDWERSLSNINQLAELLQVQSRVYRGHFALIRWLSDSISNAGAVDDESKLRLESDEQLIRIVTIHKSKGLEYPFVFVPFLFSGRGADEAWFYSYKKNDLKGYLTLDLLKNNDHLEQADSERLAEDIRLLYVALTRAKYQCYVGTTAYKGIGKKSLGLAQTAWAYLLFQGNTPKPLNDSALTDCLTTFEQRFQGVIDVQQLKFDDYSHAHNASIKEPRGKSENANKSAEKNESKSIQTLQHRIASDWRVQSFTGLMYENHAQHSLAVKIIKSPVLSESINIFGFPKGSRAGTFLHTLFESVIFETAEPLRELQAHYESLETLILKKLSLSKLVEEALVPQWSQYLTGWMKAVLTFPLAEEASLSHLKEQAYVSEMAFYFPVKQLQANKFNTLIKRFNAQAADIDFRTFEGHLKGAIDLVFQVNGQYFILDYKSNYLGETIENYQAEALQQVMNDHRYDVQYILYTLATHRYLKHRLGEGYDYERDFGGVYYLFLRGLALDSNQKNIDTGVVFIKPEFELIDGLDREFAGV